MALTRITKGVIKPNENYDTHNINSTGIITATKFVGPVTGAITGTADLASGLTGTPSITVQDVVAVGATFTGNVSIAGTLTYEDVTNVDAVGLVTARTGVVSPYADIDDWIDVGNNIQLGNAGVITATTFKGGTFFGTGADINGDIDVDGHTNLDNVSIAGFTTITQDLDVDGHTNLDNVNIVGVTTTNGNVNIGNGDIIFANNNHKIMNGSSAHTLNIQGGNSIAGGKIELRGGTGDNDIRMLTSDGSGNSVERLRIISSGNVGIGTGIPAFAAINSISASAVRGIDIFKHGTDTGTAIKLAGRPGNIGQYHYAQLGFSGANFTSHWATYNTSGTKIGEIVIGNTGNIGINTTVPSRQLEVFDATQGTIAIKSGDAGQSSLWLSDSDINIGGIYYEHNNNALGIRVNDQERLRIKSDGSVNILETGDNKGLRIHTNSGVSATNNELRFNTGQSNGFTFMANSDGTSSNQRLRITSDGCVFANNFGFGTDNRWKIRPNTSNTELAFEYSTSSTLADTNIKMFLNPSGRVLVKTVPHATSGTMGDYGLMFQASTTPTDGQVIQGITFNPHNTEIGRARAGIAALANANGGSHPQSGADLVFLTRFSADGHDLDVATDERLRITSDGLLGLNVTPSYSGLFGGSQKGMHIGGTTAPFLRITSSTGGQGDLILQAGNSGSDVQMGNLTAAGDITFWNKPSGGSVTERLRIDSSGRILINNTSNTNAHTQCDDLIIGNTSHGHDTGVTIVSGTSYNGWLAFSDGTSASDQRKGAIVYHHPSDKMYFRNTGNTTRLVIDSAGFVGINNDDPQTTLNVKGTISTGRNVARELGTVISSSGNHPGRPATNVINGNKNYEAGMDWLAPGNQRVNAWCIIDLGSSVNVGRAVIYNQNEYADSRREVKNFTLEGSNDNSSWTAVLDDDMGISGAHEPNPGWSFRIPQGFADDNEGNSYRYWRFTMKTFHFSDSYGGITEIELYEAVDSVTEEITTGSLVAGDVYAQTGCFNRITDKGGTTGLTISSDGQVTKPSSCAFNVTPSGNQSLSSGDTINSWHTTNSRGFENTQTGGYFSSGVFTAPVTGAYFFTSTILLSGVGSASGIHLYWQKNNSGCHTYWETRFNQNATGYGGYEAVSGQCTMYMSAGDTCRIKISMSGSCSLYGTDANWGNWGGFLIG